MTGDWVLGESHGDAGAFHSTEPEARRSATFHTVELPTLVLGSTQPESDVDGRVANALGVDVVRRRSGGGAVLLMPGEFVWLDLVIPAGDPLWLDDVGKAMVSDSILNKPDKLTDDEFVSIKMHPGLGYQLLLEGRGRYTRNA